MKNQILIIIILALLGASCGKVKTGDKKANNDNAKQHEKVKSSIAINEMDEIVFQLPDTKQPVVLFFDAQAAGTQFLNKYGEMFQKLNLGVVASNKYRNGIPAEEAGQVLQQMMMTAQKNGADMQQLYLMGFSGGGKFVQNLAEILPNVKAVVTMGIGKTYMHKGKVPEINILGVDDMNFRPAMMYPLHSDYTKPDLIILHAGGHEWAPVEILNYVFEYCLNHFQSDNVQLPAQQDTYVNALNIALDRFNDIQDKNGIESLNKLLGSSLEIEQKWLGSFQAMIESTQKHAWIELLEKLDKEEKDNHVKARVRGYLSMVNYMLSAKYVENGNVDKANKQLEIYKIVDPENSDIQLLQALLLDRQAKYNDAMKLISLAIEHGFNDYQKLLYMKFSDELTKREDFVLTLNQIY